MKADPKSTADKLMKLMEEKKEAVDFSQKEMDELKKCCQQVFSSPEGVMVARAMMKVSGIYKYPDLDLTPMNMACQKGLKYMYLFFVKGMLNYQTVSKIERKLK